MKKGKIKFLVLNNVVQKIAPKIGARVLIEPEWGLVGQIALKNGKRLYFKYNTLDINPMGAGELAKDKDFSNFFMKKMGYSIVPGSKTFFSDEWGVAIGRPKQNIDAAYAYALKLGFPVMVKPNSGSLGAGVALVHDEREFYRAMRAIFKQDRVALVQQLVPGRDYRLVVLDGELVAAYERTPLNVVGNGRSTITQLFAKKQKQLASARREFHSTLNDPRIRRKLRWQGLRNSSVLAKGQQVFLLDNANLSTGGDAMDVTDTVHAEFKNMAVRLTRDMGLRLCGVDVIVAGDISVRPRPNKYWILEVNASPGLDHFAKIGKKQEKMVEQLYTNVLKKMSE